MKRSASKQPQYKILTIDPWLKPYYSDIALRMQRHADTRRALLGDKGDLSSFANGYLYYGIARTEDGWVYREWAPGADEMHLIGDFNDWNRESHPMTRLENGNWEIKLDGEDALMHGQRIKVQVTKNGEKFDRIPAYIRRVVRDPETNEFYGQVWAPNRPFRWTDGGYGKRKLSPLFIYESHVGMAQEDESVGTYREFADRILDRVQEAGYNTIQLMAIMEHPYYASFGYQVTNFFAASSWYGNPEDLKYLINTAHEMGMFVLLDVVHSHASKNTNEGLNRFDGTDDQYFIAQDHPAWDTKLFNYGKYEVIHFLLSNLKFWLQEYHFDGFRFDGVTSMLYHDHGLGTDFMSYDRYFSLNTNVEAVTYLQLANELIHAVNPFAVTIAEDMSGMPGMCLPIRYGGIGFDYRLSMGVPDFWIKTLKESDENWDMRKMWHELTTRRPQEKNIGYSESHDQALVGDKTLIFRMADAEMYTGMNKDYHSITMDRAIALHKMIRFITLVLAGEGYLNFMGNEFGHPEWIDFPREGNGWSYKYARRQWSLCDNEMLKYAWLRDFDRAMLKFARKYRVLSKRGAVNLWVDQERKLLAFCKGDIIYLFNFHPTESPTNFFLPTHPLGAGDYRAVFTSDDAAFGGNGNISEDYVYAAKDVPGHGVGFEVYIPSRTAVAFKHV
ncbi:MAG TPA: alpha amylase C-terminal domain-containing protein [Candidatus Pullichristensenella excrementipullorum]|nr:alpha amylase C-terminal domain-containing protein [Candidatus Pullichristensenella excrementipullorum]